MRTSEIKRKTKETNIECNLVLDGAGISCIDTGIGFFDHMLITLAKHSSMNLDLKCQGDLDVDTHHTVEDCGIVLGQAFSKALSTENIQRYQSFIMPMDDALVLCSIDLCNRAYYEANIEFTCDRVGDFETQTVDEFFRSFASNANINLHFMILRGTNAHHIIEGMFKALAKCIHDAIQIRKEAGVLSTKGVL